MADRYLYRLRPVGFDSIELEEGEATMFNELDASTREERHVKVASFLPGFTGEGDTGFSSRDVAKRRVAMYRLYCIMLSWDGMPGMHRSTHQCAEDLSSNRVCQTMTPTPNILLPTTLSLLLRTSSNVPRCCLISSDVFCLVLRFTQSYPTSRTIVCRTFWPVS